MNPAQKRHRSSPGHTLLSTLCWLSLAGALCGAAGCRSREHFADIGDHVASPIDIAMSDDQKHFFVLNADFDRTYDQGSVLVLDTDGNKVGVVKVPRMGRSIATAGNALVITTDQPNDDNDTDSAPQAYLFDVTDPTKPVQVKQWGLNCAPLNTVMSSAPAPLPTDKGQKPNYFAIACDGNLYLGTWGADLSTADLKHVRAFNMTRRALYFDRKRELLMAFPTDTGRVLADQELLDEFAYDANALPLNAGNPSPNEVPDIMENNTRVQADVLQQETYQFMVYDLAAEKDVNTAIGNGCTPSVYESCQWPYRDSNDPYAKNELRWIYFDLANYDGSPDQSPQLGVQYFNFYRTNFYDAQPNPDDPDSFYLSQRGSPDKSPFANQIVKVTITGDISGHATPASVAAAVRTAPRTDAVMTFERVYGFKGPEATKYAYPGSFRVAHVDGKKVVVVNNFRDLINWVRDDTYFSIGAQTLDDNQSWFAEQTGSLNATQVDTYYQLALTSTGRAMTCSFYGNALVLMDVIPGVGINVVKRIE